MHIADFYDMWLSDKKQLWSIQQNIITFKANLEECEIGLQKKLEDMSSGTKEEIIWERFIRVNLCLLEELCCYV